MKAKDTVKIPEKHSESIYCPHCGEEFGIEDKVLYERETQAEISFKAGIETVVDWLREHMTFMRWEYLDSKGIWDCPIDDKEWQAKLKEWGVEQ